MYYLDTNIFVYATTTKSEKHADCLKLLKIAGQGIVNVTTSCETVQEIIHIHRLARKNILGIKISQDLLNLISQPLEINKQVTGIYLTLAEKYPKIESRDLLHLAVCVVNRIENMVTYDKHFEKFKEIKALKPEDVFADN